MVYEMNIVPELEEANPIIPMCFSDQTCIGCGFWCSIGRLFKAIMHELAQAAKAFVERRWNILCHKKEDKTRLLNCAVCVLLYL